jgi:hypothetical protein
MVPDHHLKPGENQMISAQQVRILKRAVADIVGVLEVIEDEPEAERRQPTKTERIIERLRRGWVTIAELLELTGWPTISVHQHFKIGREKGFIARNETLEVDRSNGRPYRYRLH